MTDLIQTFDLLPTKIIVSVDLIKFKEIQLWKDIYVAVLYAAVIDPIIAIFDPASTTQDTFPYVCVLFSLAFKLMFMSDVFDYKDLRMGLRKLKSGNPNHTWLILSFHKTQI